MNDAGEIIERLKLRFGVDSDSDLALRLLISRSSIENWRNRNSVPARYQKLDQGEGSLFMFGGGEMTAIESAAMRLVFLRLARDFGDVATDYRTFLEKSGKAGASIQLYFIRAVKDLVNEMEVRETDDAYGCVSLMAYDEVFSEN